MPIYMSTLEDLLTADPCVNEWNTLICNVTDEQLTFIKDTINKTKKANVIDILIEFDEHDLRKMANIIDTLLYSDLGVTIWGDYLFALIYKGILENFNTDQKDAKMALEQLNNYLNINEGQSIKEYHEMTMAMQFFRYFDYSSLNRYIDKINKTVILHFIGLDKVTDPRLQIAINILVAQRGNPTVRIYTSNPRLITYATNPTDKFDHPIEMTHDYTFYAKGIDETIAYQKRK